MTMSSILRNCLIWSLRFDVGLLVRFTPSLLNNSCRSALILGQRRNIFYTSPPTRAPPWYFLGLMEYLEKTFLIRLCTDQCVRSFWTFCRCVLRCANLCLASCILTSIGALLSFLISFTICSRGTFNVPLNGYCRVSSASSRVATSKSRCVSSTASSAGCTVSV
jgi:hypothetical protein